LFEFFDDARRVGADRVETGTFRSQGSARDRKRSLEFVDFAAACSGLLLCCDRGAAQRVGVGASNVIPADACDRPGIRKCGEASRRIDGGCRGF
jgi:hypothetical protein